MSQATHLDCIGLQCPEPIIRLCMAIKRIAPGDTLVIEATDLAFRADLHAWSAMTGNPVLSFDDGSPKRATVLKAVAGGVTT